MMMRLAPATLLAFSAFALPASAALPPYWQRVAEIERIMADPRVQEGLNGDVIDRIESIGDNHYKVTGGGCTIEVDIIARDVKRPEGWAGPLEFDVSPRKPNCN